MVENILVATPARMETSGAILARSEELFASLTYANRRRALFLNDYGYSRDYSTNARARNRLIDLELAGDVVDVLWIDVDIIDYPADLIERLLEHRAATGAQIVAPMVMIHRRDCDRDVFYDIGGFVQDGHWVIDDTQCPPFDCSRDLESVGSCYLMPAQYFRDGARYASYSAAGLDHTEHYSVMQFARNRGARIRATSETKVYHAWLPAFGMKWQGEVGVA